MKKLVLLIFLLNIGFSTVISGIGKNTDTMISNNKLDCIYISNPDILLERMLNKLKKEKKSNDIFCDREGMKMAYYLIEGEDYNLTLGIAIPVDLSTTNTQFKENFLKKLDEYRTFFRTLDKRNANSIPLPDKEVIRFYGQITGTDKFFVIGKYINDLNINKQKMVVSSQGKVFFDKIDLFNGMTVEYSDEIVF